MNLEDEFNDLTRSIEQTREKRDEFNASTQELIKLIKETNSHIKEHLKTASEFREKRDAFNENVQGAKNNRITTQIALEELRKKLNEIREKNKDVGRISPQQQIEIKKLRSAVRARNMKIETEPTLSIKDEDKLIKEIEEFETKLNDLTKGTEARREYSNLIAQFPAYKNQLKKYHDEVIENSENSQKFHEQMLKEYEQVDKLREKIQELEKQLNQSRKQADEFHAQLLGFYKKRDEMRMEISTTQKEIRTQRRKERGNMAVLVRRIAKDHLEKGLKLSYVEFRLLLEKGEIAGMVPAFTSDDNEDETEDAVPAVEEPAESFPSLDEPEEIVPTLDAPAEEMAPVKVTRLKRAKKSSTEEPAGIVPSIDETVEAAPLIEEKEEVAPSIEEITQENVE